MAGLFLVMTTLPSPPDLDPELLLRENRWLRVLAERLFRDEHAAADAVQQTWLAYLRSPPREQRSVRSWLRTTLLRVRARATRSERRRSAHEGRADEPPGSESARSSVERAELQSVVLNLVLTLREPYRATLVLRYFDGLSTKEIARRQEIAVGTVDSRLHRALAVLRTQLDESFGERGRWMAAFVTTGLVSLRVAEPLTVGLAVGGAGLLAGAAGLVLWTQWPREVEPPEVESPAVAVSSALAAESPGPRVSALEERSAAAPRGGIGIVGVTEIVGEDVQGAEALPDEDTAAPVEEAPLTDEAPLGGSDRASESDESSGISLDERRLVRLVRNYFEDLDQGHLNDAAEELREVENEVSRIDSKTPGSLLANVAFWRRVLDRAGARTPAEEKKSPDAGWTAHVPRPDSQLQWKAYRHLPRKLDRDKMPLLPVVVSILPPEDSQAVDGSRRDRSGKRPRGRPLETEPRPLDVLARKMWSGPEALKEAIVLLVDAPRPDDPIPAGSAVPSDFQAVVEALGDCVLWDVPADLSRVVLTGSGRAFDLAARFPGLFSAVAEFVEPVDRPSIGPLRNLAGTAASEIFHHSDGEWHVSETHLDGDVFDSRSTTIRTLLDLVPPFAAEGHRSPSTIVAEPPKGSLLFSSWWVQVLDADHGLESSGAFLVRADRERNEVHLLVDESIRALRLYLNDDLLDLDRPISLRLDRQRSPSVYDDPALLDRDHAFPVLADQVVQRSLEQLLQNRYRAQGSVRDVYSAVLDVSCTE